MGYKIKKVRIGNTIVWSNKKILATQGPCDGGFHVPLYTELQALAQVMSYWNMYNQYYYQLYLHMPPAGSMAYTTGTVSTGRGYYLSSNRDINYPGLLLMGNTSQVSYSLNTSYGLPIRPFKDEFVEADSSWSYFVNAANYGAYNSTLGLISLKYGNYKITIADKNLGATTVYNYNDTMSSANCGKYYQWGNNHGFPFSGATTTSTTAVDASNNGPGNYYESDTFITYNDNWDTSKNTNLWGGVTGNVYVWG